MLHKIVCVPNHYLELLHSGVEGPLGFGVSGMGLNDVLRRVDVFVHEALQMGDQLLNPRWRVKP